MGFFDALKSIGRVITGGGAKVHVDIGQATRGGPFPVRVKVLVSDADVNISNVYLLVRAQEEVRINRDGMISSFGDGIRDFLADGRLDGVVHRQESCDFRLNISGPETLKANQEYTFEGSVQLPSGARPSFQGINCEHVWTLQAGLDAFGNDPDSGWVEFQVA